VLECCDEVKDACQGLATTEPVLDYRPPEPPPKFSWRRVAILFPIVLLILIAVAFAVAFAIFRFGLIHD
jgi:hypothetical protein